jgi:hypothetical protein
MGHCPKTGEVAMEIASFRPEDCKARFSAAIRSDSAYRLGELTEDDISREFI